MAEFKPDIGLVIRHAYLWWNEARAGREEGLKDRPCVIVHTVENGYGEAEVYIAPITHTPPEAPERAMEISKATKARLRLDAQTSWIITTEVNRFIWPGPDIRAAPGGRSAYGLLPAAMARDLVQQIKDNARDRALLVVSRDRER
jgi:hypothetical protein